MTASASSAPQGKMTVAEFAQAYLGETVVRKADLVDEMRAKLGRKPPRWCWQPAQRVDRGVYNTEWQKGNKFKETFVAVPDAVEAEVASTASTDSTSNSVNDATVAAPTAAAPTAAPTVAEVPKGALVPKKFQGFFSTPQYAQIRQVIKSGLFFPIYITGDTGGGKTLAVRQACAVTRRELVRVNITSTTSDVHLIGSYKLIDGHTIWQDGPVVTAMRRGAVLLLDEIDLATDRILCLQSVLEGNPVLIERTGEIVEPAPGFTVMATANTKGRIDASNAKFAGARTQNEAFLDRFSMTIDYPYPTEKTEGKILSAAFDRALASVGLKRGKADDEFFSTFFAWVRAIRESYLAGSADAHISTRRAESILVSYAIFGANAKKAIMGGVSRFDDNSKDSFLRLFNGLAKEGLDIDFAANDDAEDGNEDG